FPNTIAFSCDEGFDLFGSPVRSCTSRGAWSGTVTSCNAVDCGPLSPPMNGSASGRFTVFPNVVKFSCDKGFNLLGSSIRKCTSKGKWNGSITTCQGKKSSEAHL
ncbi:predicted protein, partial [Nematostella vectensis]